MLDLHAASLSGRVEPKAAPGSPAFLLLLMLGAAVLAFLALFMRFAPCALADVALAAASTQPYAGMYLL